MRQQRAHRAPRRTAWLRAVCVGATSGLLLIGAVGVTSAAYHDQAALHTVIGTPNVFTVQAKDAAGVWQNASTADAAVVIPASPAAEIGTRNPAEFAVYFRLHPDSPSGDITPTIRANPGCDDRCGELFERMRFTATLDGIGLGAPVSAAEFNQLADRSINGAQPGADHVLSLSVVLDPKTPAAWSGSTTGFGVTFDGIAK